MRVYRNVPRNVGYGLAFCFGAAFFFGAAALARRQPGLAIALGVVGLLCAAVAVRSFFLRVEVTPRGLRRHGMVGNRSVAWAEMVGVRCGHDGMEPGPGVLLPGSRTPVVLLAGGGKLKLDPLTSYALRKPTTKADRIAAELEALRAAGTAR